MPYIMDLTFYRYEFEKEIHNTLKGIQFWIFSENMLSYEIYIYNGIGRIQFNNYY